MKFTEEMHEWMKEDINNLKETVVLMAKQVSFKLDSRLLELLLNLETQVKAYRFKKKK
tara:strand:- start:148 stop:321 length:174 start_codon:yes stop_codon:yes gene_type:complete